MYFDGLPKLKQINYALTNFLFNYMPDLYQHLVIFTIFINLHFKKDLEINLT